MRYETIAYKVLMRTHLYSTLRLCMPRTPRSHGVGLRRPGRIEQVLSYGFQGAIAIDIGIQCGGGDPEPLRYLLSRVPWIRQGRHGHRERRCGHFAGTPAQTSPCPRGGEAGLGTFANQRGFERG